MSRARNRFRWRGKTDDEARPRGAAFGEGSSPAQSGRMPAYARGQDATPNVPLMDSASGAVELKARGERMPDERMEEANARQPTPTRELPGPATFADNEQATNEQAISPARKDQTLDEVEAAKTGSHSATPVPDVSGAGEKTRAMAYSLTLRGRTDANFGGGTFRTTGRSEER